MKLARVRLREEARAWTGTALLGGETRQTWIVELHTACGQVAQGEVAWLPRAGPPVDVPMAVAAWAWGWLGRALPKAGEAPGVPAPIAWAITAALADLHGDWAPEAIAENGLLTAGAGSPAEVAAEWSRAVSGHPEIRTWKIKVGRTSFEEDVARLRALSLPPGVQLRLDPNRGWGALDPGFVAEALQGLPIAYIEEPVAWPALADWGAAGLPCAADESVLEVPIAELARAGMHAVVLKPSVLGGVGAVQALAEEAVGLGLHVVLSSSLEGPVGKRHLEALAATLPEPRAAAGLARQVLVEPPVRVEPRGDWTVASDPLRRAAEVFPDALALDAGYASLSFRQWHEASDAEAARLGARLRERIAVEIHGIEGVIRLFAVLRAGAIACLVPPGVQRAAAMEQVGASEFGEGRGEPPGIDLGRVATLVWSSGSQGQPKAIAHSLGQHLASAAASHVHTPFGEGDRWIASLQMHHVGGLALLFRALIAGGTVVFPAGRAFDALVPTHLSWVPTQLMRAPQTPPPTLKHLLLGGAAAPPALVAERRALGWPVKTTYGSTETASQACTSTTTEDPTESGRALLGRTVEASPRIRVRGTTVCLGIWSGDGVTPITDEQGWLVTGDVGELTPTGALRVHGRADSMFISGGENVFPESIERVLGAHPQVAAVVVVAVPDPVWGARPWAFMDSELSLEEARSYLKTRLPRHAWVDRVLPWDSQGVGSTGKPRRAWFQARALALSRGEDAGSP